MKFQIVLTAGFVGSVNKKTMITKISDLKELSGLSKYEKTFVIQEYEKIEYKNSVLLNWNIFTHGFIILVIVFLLYFFKPFGELHFGWIIIPYILLTSICAYGFGKLFSIVEANLIAPKIIRNLIENIEEQMKRKESGTEQQL